MIVKLTVSLEVPGQGAIYSKSHTVSEDEGTYQELILASGSVDSAVSFGGVTTGDILFLTSDQSISWRQSLTDTAIALDANRVHVLCGTDVTAVYLTNLSGSDANVRIMVAGT